MCFHKENLFILQYDFIFSIYPQRMMNNAAFWLSCCVEFASKALKYIGETCLIKL